jgi:hypothetical protein
MSDRPRARVGALLLLASGACVAHAACAGPASLPPEGAVLSAARFDLAWANGRAVRQDDGALRWVTDRGHEVTLRRGQLATYASSIAECDPGVLASLLAPLGPGLAHAGHGEAADPSTVAGVIETIGAEVPLAQGASAFAPKDYCRAHWVAAPADASTRGAVEAGMEGASLVLEGEWSRGGATGTFAWRSTVATGALQELPPLTGSAVHVTVVRSLDTLLDGIDFESATTASAGRAVLLNLALQTLIEARPD